MASDICQEMMDVVNRRDEVTGRLPREEIYKQSLMHRIVHVIVFDNTGKIALQKRSSVVSFCPSHWSTSAGGHVQSGESYREAAERELKEELGISLPLRLMKKHFYRAPNTPNKFLSVYKAVFDGPFDFDHGVVSEISFFTTKQIGEMIEGGKKIHPELLFIFRGL